MVRTQTSNYQADADTTFWWATVDGDMFDRELDMSFVARALERHDHSANRGVAVARVAAGSIVTASYAAGSVNTAALGDLQVTNPKIAAFAVDNAKLAVGAAVANIGYTPVNKAGDTMSANLAFSTTHTGILLSGAGSGGGTLLRDGLNVQCEFLVQQGVLAVYDKRDNFSLFYINRDTGQILFGPAVVWTSGNDGPGSGLDADLLDSQSSAFYLARANHTGANNADTLDGLDSTAFALVANGVPVGACVAFRTAAEITAAGASWTQDTNFNGRIVVGAGTTFGQTFAQNTHYGSNWTPVTGLTNTTVIASTSPDTGATAGGLNLNPLGHTHPAPTIVGQNAAWLPPMYALVWARKVS